MEKAKINAIQLFALMFIFDLGTALVVSYGIGAKKDAWLAILLGMGVGLVLFCMYYYLFRQYPTLPLTGYAQKIFGKYLGWFVAFLYILYFLNIAARNTRDFGDLLISSTLQDTPLLAIVILFILTVCYVVYLGIEVLGRTAEVFIVMLCWFGAIGNFLVLVSGNVNIQRLFPFFEYGWKPIVTEALLNVSLFPYGEMIAFTMLLPYLNRQDAVKKVWLSAVLVSGLILMWTASVNIAVLGVSEMERSTFPIIATVAKVNLLDFIQRIDSIIVYTMLITVFFKVAVFLYAAAVGIAHLFKFESHKPLVLPAGCIVVCISMIMASSFTEHLEEGRKVLRIYIHIPLFVVVPLLMVIVAMVRSHFKKGKDAKDKLESNKT